MQIGLFIVLAIVTVVLSLQTYFEDTRWVIFTLLLTLNVAAPGAESWSGMRWRDWAMAFLALVGLLLGL